MLSKVIGTYDKSSYAIRIVIVYIFALIVGCNKYRDPIVINPKGELGKSAKIAKMGGSTIHLPFGWQLGDYYDSNSVEISRVDGKVKKASIFITNEEQTPKWINNASRKSTDRHSNVPYLQVAAQAPSGDDTPGKYEMQAYLMDRDVGWLVTISFFSPVKPSVDEALWYLDMIEFANIEKQKD